MSRRRMMMQNRVVNLFDKNSEDIEYNARLDFSVGTTAKFKDMFVSHFIRVAPGMIYVLERKPFLNAQYSRWTFYKVDKTYDCQSGEASEVAIIQIPKNCYYIRFNGLITDIDNVKFYKA